MTQHPAWFESRLPGAREVSLGHQLAQRATTAPDSALLVGSDGTAVSTQALYVAVTLTAQRLAGLGIKRGDRLLVWLPTGQDMVRVILACSLLGATIVPLNTSMRGSMLAHMIALAQAEVMICHAGLIERLAGISLSGLKTIVLPSGDSVKIPGADVCVEDSLVRATFDTALNDPWDIAAIIFSSGTTGSSKGVRVPLGQLWTLARAFYGWMEPSDRVLLMYPLFHIAGFSAIFAAMNAGASLAVTEAFSGSDFWNLLRRTGSTTTPGLGPTFIDVLIKPEPRASDFDNPLRRVTVQAITPTALAFAARFGCSIVAGYSMTETSGICVSDVDAIKTGIVGRPRDGLQVRVVDPHDVEVAVGKPGELIVRSDVPWTLNDGYEANAEESTRAWRNGWFHTGDVVRRDEDGDISFVDRKKDVIRRRSENISSSEVEAEVRRFPAVQDAAAIGVMAAGGEEVLIAVTAVPGHSVVPEELIAFLIARMPHFMVPRYVRVMQDLPKTHTNRVQKESLREEGLAVGCWDREAAGIRLRGQRLSNGR